MLDIIFWRISDSASIGYGDFEKPPRGKMFSIEWGGINGISEAWREQTAEEVKAAIAQLIGDNFSVDTFEKNIKH